MRLSHASHDEIRAGRGRWWDTSAATRNSDQERKALGLPALIAALIVLLLHAWLLAGWIVDDAGITFAYAKNLASGHGLVSQPGQPAVEGFSNPLWTFVVAGLYAVGLFDLHVAPKILGVSLAAVVLVLIWQDLRWRARSHASLAVPLVLLAACSPFVIWTTSGLENALLAVLIVVSARLSLQVVSFDNDDPTRDLMAGVVAGLAALTRPDALVYAAMYPLASLLADARRGWPAAVGVWRRWLWYGCGLLPVYGGYLLFRIRYFDDVVPNTFYAKPKPSLSALVPGKLLDLVESASGDLFPFVLLFLAVGGAALLLKRKLEARTTVLATYLGAATFAFLVMPSDWMGEFRFATAFYPLLFWTLSDVVLATSRLPSMLRFAPAFQVGVVVFTMQAVTLFSARTLVFAARPTVPLDEVQAYAGDGFNRLADTLGTNDMSVLTPDLGGALLNSKMRVYDLAGLCDRRIARALSANDVDGIQDYVFDELRPTFIHTHGAFTLATRLNEDARFARDYVPIYEHLTGPQDWQQMWRGNAPAWSGDYVRRDALGPNLERLEQLKQVYRRDDLVKFVPWIGAPDRLRQGYPQLVWAAERLTAGSDQVRRPELAPR